MCLKELRDEFLYDCECRHLAKGSLRNYRASTRFLLEFLERKQITELEDVRPRHLRDLMKEKQDVIDHGVNLDKFKASTEKDNSFVVCSQLIERKKIDGILEKFAMYLDQYNSTCQLFIIGEGELKEKLQRMAQTLGIAPNVIFTGKMTHDELLPILSKSKALLVNTVKDNNMISIVEAIAVGTPIVTTDVPLNSTYIKEYQLGIAKKQWDESDLNDVVSNSDIYIENCMKYRYKLSTKQRVEQFIEIERERLDDGKT